MNASLLGTTRQQSTLWVVGRNGFGGACFHRHQAHPVGDNMQLSGDTGSLLVLPGMQREAVERLFDTGSIAGG